MDGLDSENHVDGSRSQPSRYGIQGPLLFCSVVCRMVAFRGYMPKRAAAVVARQEQRSFSIYADESGRHSITSIDENNPVFVLSFSVLEKEQFSATTMPSMMRCRSGTRRPQS